MRRLRGVNTFTGFSDCAHRFSIHCNHHFPKCQNKATPDEAPTDVMPQAAQNVWPAATIADGVTTNFYHGGKLPQNEVDQREFSRFHPPNYIGSLLASSTM